ncbi:MAG: ketoacyl-ACP synthase III [Saprospirales bacterium]|nr:ketoacyl-ACP synthase III [Saprospirales bacterium]
MRNANIISTGAYAPDWVLPNALFDELLGEEVDTWLRENVHIYERRWCRENESTADLAERAGKQALERAGVEAGAVDLVIVATDTPEFVSPSTASVVQYRLGAKNAGSFDINTACAGFVTALDMGAKYIRADEHYRYVLIIGAYAMSKYLNKSDKKTVTLFADGAGAVLLGPETREGFGLLASQLISEGQYNGWMGIYGGGAHMPTDEKVLANHDHQLKFVQKFPPELNPEHWTAMTHTLSQRIGVPVSEVDHFFITQINIHSIWETLDRLGVPREKGHTIMHYYGYTGSACIGMAMNDAWEKGILKKGDLSYCIGSGGGLAFASAAIRL